MIVSRLQVRHEKARAEIMRNENSKLRNITSSDVEDISTSRNLSALFVLIAGHFVVDTNTSAIIAFLPFIKESLQLTYTLTASVVLVFNVISSIMHPVFGYITDRFPSRWLLPSGCLVASLGLSLLGFATSYTWILFFVGLSGIGEAGYHPSGFKAASFFAEKKKATAFSFFHLGGNVGFALGPILATFLGSHLGLSGTIFFLFPGMAIFFVFMMTSHWKIREPMIPFAPKTSKGQKSFRPNMAPMAFLLLTVIFRAVARLGLLTFTPFYFIQILNWDAMIWGKYLSAFLLAGTAGIALGGPLADRFGYKRMALISLALTSLFLCFFFLTRGTVSLIFFMAAGLTILSSNSVTMAIGQSLMPRNLGMASGLILGSGMGIGGIGAAILGWIADQWGISFTLQLIFVFPILSFLALLFVPYPTRFGVEEQNGAGAEAEP